MTGNRYKEVLNQPVMPHCTVPEMLFFKMESHLILQSGIGRGDKFWTGD